MKHTYAIPAAVILALSADDLLCTSEFDPENPVLKIDDLGWRDLL